MENIPPCSISEDEFTGLTLSKQKTDQHNLTLFTERKKARRDIQNILIYTNLKYTCVNQHLKVGSRVG